VCVCVCVCVFVCESLKTDFFLERRGFDIFCEYLWNEMWCASSCFWQNHLIILMC